MFLGQVVERARENTRSTENEIKTEAILVKENRRLRGSMECKAVQSVVFHKDICPTGLFPSSS